MYELVGDIFFYLPLRKAVGLKEPDLARKNGTTFFLHEDVDLVLVSVVDDVPYSLLWLLESFKLIRRNISIF